MSMGEDESKGVAIEDTKYTVVNLKLRHREYHLHKLLCEQGFKNGDIFRLGLLTAIEKVKQRDSKKKYESIWEDIAKIAILSK